MSRVAEEEDEGDSHLYEPEKYEIPQSLVRSCISIV